MATEIIENAAAATITAGGRTASSGDNSLTVTTGTGWTALTSGQQLRIMDQADEDATSGYEIMLLSGPATTGTGVTWSVTRAVEGSTLKTHSANWTAIPVLTSAGLDGRYLGAVYTPVPGWVYVTGLVNDSGASNQLAAIQAAENLLPAAGGWLVFPAYTIGCSAWVPKAGTCIQGAGMGSQAGDGATTFVLPTGDTTSQYVINFANGPNQMRDCSVDALSLGAKDAGGKGYVTAVLGTNQDLFIENCYITGGTFAALQTITNGVGRSRILCVTTQGIGGSGVVRTITSTCGITTNSNVLTDSGASFTAADVGRGISPNTTAVGGSNTVGIPLGTRLTTYFTIRSGTASNVAAIVSAGTINLSNNTHLVAATASVSVMTSQGPTTFQYTGTTGSGATTQLTGVTYVSGASGSSALVAVGNNVVNTTTIKLDQAATATQAAATVTLVQNFSAILGATDTEYHQCRFVQGTNIIGNETNSSATQGTLTHFTNTLTSADNMGGMIAEGSINQIGCYYDTCPPNGSNVVHKSGVKQGFISAGYTFNNQATNPSWYTENDSTNGFTVKSLGMQPPQGTWANLVNLSASSNGANPGVIIDGIDAVDNTVFTGTTLASLITGGTTQPPFGVGKLTNVYVNGVWLDQPVVPNHTVTVTTNAGTVPVTSGLNTFTNSSAATMTITMATTGAYDGQQSVVRVYDFSAASETITWVNTENGGATAPTTSNGSTTLPKTVTFMFNAATTKWRCVAAA